LLALLGDHHILHFSRIRIKGNNEARKKFETQGLIGKNIQKEERKLERSVETRRDE
jgi:hypothetical protein